jgi:lipid-binding SYLF domain-containing protein
MLTHRFSKSLKLIMLVWLALVLHNAHAGDDLNKAKQLIGQATKSIRTFVREPSLQNFRRQLRQARAVVIVPHSIEVGFILGGSGGAGVVLTRAAGNGWRGPAFYTASSGKVGLLAGAKVSELILLIMNQQTLDRLLEGKFKFAASAGVTVVSGAAATSSINADVISYALSKGAFGGVSLEGGVLEFNSELNHAYYGMALTGQDILIKGKLGKRRAFKLIATLQRFAGH